MKSSRASQRGNIIVAVLGIVIVIALGAFALNYANIFRTHKQAATAIDSAALEAARQIAHVAIVVPPAVTGGEDGQGQIGLVDYPADLGGQLDHPATFAFNTGIQRNKPVRGINTAIATARLDLRIATLLHNRRMRQLAIADLAALDRACARLNEAIDNALVHPALVSAVNAAYTLNNPTSGAMDGPLQLVSGHLKGGTAAPNQQGVGETNIPLPAPQRDDAVNPNRDLYSFDRAGGVFYRANTLFEDTGAEGEGVARFIFGGIGNEPSLVNAGEFETTGEISGLHVPKSAVRVIAKHRPAKLEGSRAPETSSFQVVACAQAGAPIATFPSSAYSIGFVGGLPGGFISQTPAGGLTDPLRTDQLRPVDLLNAPLSTWNVTGSGDSLSLEGQPNTWFRAPNDQSVPPAGLRAGSLNGQNVSDPSTALAIGMYHWLRSLGLRPNVRSVQGQMERTFANVAGANNPLANAGNNRRSKIASKWSDCFAAQAARFKPPVVLDDDDIGVGKEEDTPEPDETSDVPVCIVAPEQRGESDPRFLALTGAPAGAHDLLHESSSFKPLDVDCPDNALVGFIDPLTGRVVAPGQDATNAREDVSVLCRLTEGLIATSRAGCVSRYGGLLAAKVAKRKQTIIKRAEDKLKKVREYLEGAVTDRRNLVQTRLTEANAADYNAQASGFDTTIKPELNNRIMVFNSVIAEEGWDQVKYLNGRQEGDPLQFTDMDPILAGINPLPTYDRVFNSYNVPSVTQNQDDINALNSYIATTIPQITPLEPVLDRQFKRWYEVRQRALSARYNGKFAHNRVVRVIRKLRKWTGNGVKELVEGDGLRFAVNFGGTGGKGNPGKRSPRLIQIEPNNEDSRSDIGSTIRAKFDNNGKLTPVFEGHWFDIDPFTAEDCVKMAKVLTDVEILDGQVTASEQPSFHYMQRPKKNYTVKAPFSDIGHETIHTQALGDDKVPPGLRNRWDAQLRGGNDANESRFNIGVHVVRKYKEGKETDNAGNAGDANKVANLRQAFTNASNKVKFLSHHYKDRNLNGWFGLPALAQDIPLQPTTVSMTATGSDEGIDVPAAPVTDSVFIFTIQGADIGSTFQGGFNNYPFQSPGNRTLPGQIVYMATDVLTQGNRTEAGAPIIQRSVFARDQIANLDAFNSITPDQVNDFMQPRNWCTSNTFGFNLDTQNGANPCPISAGEWRIGPGICYACCRLDLGSEPFRKARKRILHYPIPRKFAIRLDDPTYLDEAFFTEDFTRAEFFAEDRQGDPTLDEDPPSSCPEISRRFT